MALSITFHGDAITEQRNFQEKVKTTQKLPSVTHNHNLAYTASLPYSKIRSTHWNYVAMIGTRKTTTATVHFEKLKEETLRSGFHFANHIRGKRTEGGRIWYSSNWKWIFEKKTFQFKQVLINNRCLEGISWKGTLKNWFSIIPLKGGRGKKNTKNLWPFYYIHELFVLKSRGQLQLLDEATIFFPLNYLNI